MPQRHQKKAGSRCQRTSRHREFRSLVCWKLIPEEPGVEALRKVWKEAKRKGN